MTKSQYYVLLLLYRLSSVINAINIQKLRFREKLEYFTVEIFFYVKHTSFLRKLCFPISVALTTVGLKNTFTLLTILNEMEFIHDI